MDRKLHNIEPEELQEWIKKGSCLLIDVREPQEYYYEHIANAELFPSSTFNPSQLPEHHGKAIVFYCKGGVRSAKAAKRYLENGALEAYHLVGGIEFWKANGFPVEGGFEQSTDSATGLDQ